VTPSSPLGETAASARLATLRHIAGVSSIIVGLIVLTAMITQITDQIAFGRFEPTEYFAFFTVQTSLINVVVLLAGGVLAFTMVRDTRLYTAVRASAFAYAIVTGVVYNLLLSDIANADGYVGPVWANQAQHVWVPIYFALDWLLTPGRVRIGWSTVWLAVCFPIIWVIITLARGEFIDGWYPYPFLDLNGPAGVMGVAIYVVAIAVAIVVLTVIAILINRVHTRGVRGVSEGRRGTGPINLRSSRL